MWRVLRKLCLVLFVINIIIKQNAFHKERLLNKFLILPFIFSSKPNEIFTCIVPGKIPSIAKQKKTAFIVIVINLFRNSLFKPFDWELPSSNADFCGGWTGWADFGKDL